MVCYYPGRKNFPRIIPTVNRSPNSECKTEASFMAGIISEGVRLILNVFSDRIAVGMQAKEMRANGETYLKIIKNAVKAKVKQNIPAKSEVDLGCPRSTAMVRRPFLESRSASRMLFARRIAATRIDIGIESRIESVEICPVWI